MLYRTPSTALHTRSALYGGLCLWLVSGQFCSKQHNSVSSVRLQKTCWGKSIPFPALFKHISISSQG